MKKKIALVTGGYTGERVVSLKSAATVYQNLDKEKFDVYKVVIDKEGWFYKNEEDKSFGIDLNDFSLNLNGEKVLFDAVYICMHGSPGEDGKLQGYFDMLNIPYTGCGQLTSAITMNKAYTKAIVSGISELNTAKYVQAFKNSTNAVSEIKNTLSLPIFIKPNNGGSSIGMSKVKTYDDLKPALEKAFAEDTEVIAEEFISGREFSVGAYRQGKEIVVLPATEVLTVNEFFDFEAKYTHGKSKEITPGRMTEEERLRVERIIKSVYQKLNCRGVVRVDYFLENNTGKFFFIEINTIPGQTDNSFIPQQVKAADRLLKEVYTDLIEEALSIKK